MAIFSETSTRDQGKATLWVILAVLVVIVYLFVFPRGLGKDSFLVPIKAIPLNSVPVDAKVTAGWLFRLGDNEGALAPDGTPLFFRPARLQSVVSGHFSAWYDPVADQTNIEDFSGPLFHKGGKNYPYWIGDRLYFLENDRLGVTETDLKGDQLWSKHFTSLVTALDAGSTLTAIGTMDGRVLVFDKVGTPRGSFTPGGSRYPILYNVAISRDERRILILSGLDPKRFLVLEKGGGDFRPVFHQDLSDQRPYPTPLGFFPGDRWSYFTTLRDLTLLDLKTDKETAIPMQGQLRGITFDPSGDLITSVTGNDASSLLHVWSTNGNSVLYAPFQARDVLIFTIENRLILVTDQTVLIMERRLE